MNKPLYIGQLWSQPIDLDSNESSESIFKDAGELRETASFEEQEYYEYDDEEMEQEQEDWQNEFTHTNENCAEDEFQQDYLRDW